MKDNKDKDQDPSLNSKDDKTTKRDTISIILGSISLLFSLFLIPIAISGLILGIIPLIISAVLSIIAIVGLDFGITCKKQGDKDKSKIIVNSIAIGINLIFIVTMVTTIATTQKMTCSSPNNNITILYDNTDLRGFISYDTSLAEIFDQRYVAHNHIYDYLRNFKDNYEKESNGFCLL